MRFLRAARRRLALQGRPRRSLGSVPLSWRRTLAMALSTALFSSAMTWNSHIWCGIGPKIPAMGVAYSGEPSVLMPLSFKLRLSSSALNRWKNRLMSCSVGS